MRHPDPSIDFNIGCDASIDGLGATLQQHDSLGKWYHIALATRTLRPNEKEWTITKLKALVVLWASKKRSAFTLGEVP